MQLMSFTANSLLKILFLNKWKEFEKSTYAVEKVQTSYLFNILNKNARSVYGRKYRFNMVSSIREYQKQVPITDYQDYLYYIEDIRKGITGVLTDEQVKLLVPTSGTSSATKLIPYTESLKREFQNGIGPWIYNLFKIYPGLLWGKAYWAISPNTINVNNRDSTISIGFEQDDKYLNHSERFLFSKTMVVPGDISRINSIDSHRYITLLYLLSEPELRLISIWNPTYLELLLQKFDSWADSLIKDIQEGEINTHINIPDNLLKKLKGKIKKNPKRSQELNDIVVSWRKKTIDYPWNKIWPNLNLISCWTDAWAKKFVPKINEMFPNTIVQSKGLLSTEAFVTFPIESISSEKTCHALSVTSHFFEFEDCDTKEIKLAHEMGFGKKYSVIVTTGGGLYRYRLNDQVLLEGTFNQVPLLKFIGKTENISDLFGEKLHEDHVRAVLSELFNKFSVFSNFYFIAPESYSGSYCYVLFIEHQRQDFDYFLLAQEIDLKLCKNYHYKYCRDLGQLGKLNIFLMSNEAREIFLTKKSKVAKLGTVKYSFLEKQTGWVKVFENTKQHNI